MTSSICIGKKNIGGDSPCYIIAETSANHAGDINRAIEIIHAANDAGADCIKIQTYTADTLTIPSSKEYFQINDGKWKGESLYSLYEKAHTPWEWQERLKHETEKLGMDFLSTPFDKTAVDFLEKLGVGFYKIASFELTDIPLIEYVASQGKPMILSTGMATLDEIREAVHRIRSLGNHKICLLKCSSAYPAISEDMNLKTMESMQKIFNVPVGLSDHTLGPVSAIAAVALGAKVIEKHFCISRETETPDSSFSMEYGEFKEMVRHIRDAEKALGTVNYEITNSERMNRIFRKSIFVVQDVPKGTTLNENNVRVIRPGHGLEPKYYKDILGKTAAEDIARETPLQWELMNNGSDLFAPAKCGGRVLRADRLTLREIQEDDEEDIIRWRNHKDILSNLFSQRGPTLSEHREWYRQYIETATRLEFVILRNSDGKKLGTVGLSSIDSTNCKAELGILLCEREERGKGYAYEASRSCIQYGFDVLNLNKISLRVFSTNLSALKLYKKLGFRQEGLLEKEVYKDDHFMDVIQMGLLQQDWNFHYA